jgi:hypothetical protein
MAKQIFWASLTCTQIDLTHHTRRFTCFNRRHLPVPRRCTPVHLTLSSLVGHDSACNSWTVSTPKLIWYATIGCTGTIMVFTTMRWYLGTECTPHYHCRNYSPLTILSPLPPALLPLSTLSPLSPLSPRSPLSRLSPLSPLYELRRHCVSHCSL